MKSSFPTFLDKSRVMILMAAVINPPKTPAENQGSDIRPGIPGYSRDLAAAEPR